MWVGMNACGCLLVGNVNATFSRFNIKIMIFTFQSRDEIHSSFVAFFLFFLFSSLSISFAVMRV